MYTYYSNPIYRSTTFLLKMENEFYDTCNFSLLFLIFAVVCTTSTVPNIFISSKTHVQHCINAHASFFLTFLCLLTLFPSLIAKFKIQILNLTIEKTLKTLLQPLDQPPVVACIPSLLMFTNLK